MVLSGPVSQGGGSVESVKGRVGTSARRHQRDVVFATPTRRKHVRYQNLDSSRGPQGREGGSQITSSGADDVNQNLLGVFRHQKTKCRKARFASKTSGAGIGKIPYCRGNPLPSRKAQGNRTDNWRVGCKCFFPENGGRVKCLRNRLSFAIQ